MHNSHPKLIGATEASTNGNKEDKAVLKLYSIFDHKILGKILFQTENYIFIIMTYKLNFSCLFLSIAIQHVKRKQVDLHRAHTYITHNSP